VPTDALLALVVLSGCIGALVAILAARLRASSTPGASPGLKLTSTWRLSELGSPLVVARDVEAGVPPGTRIVASGQVAPEAFAVAQVRQVPAVTAEYAVDAAGKRALLFLGGVRPGSQAMPCADADLVARLAAEATALWERAEPYVERRALADAASRQGLAVETQGTVLDVLPYQGAFLLRLEDNGQVLGVRVEREPSELKGQRVVVRGHVAKDKGGYPVLVASDLRRLQ
jgi:hypothetical protein